MHIALVIERFDPQGGGAERSTAQIAHELAAAGHRVTILAGQVVAREAHPDKPAGPDKQATDGTQADSGQADADGPLELVEAEHADVQGQEAFEMRSLDLKGRFGAMKLRKFAVWARNELAKGKYDASLSVTTTVPASVVQPRSGTLKETFARNVAIRSGAVSRGFKRLTLAVSPKHQLLLSLERQTLRDPMVRRFAAVSEYVRTQLVQGYGVDPSRIEIIPNAAAMPKVTPQERVAHRQQIRQGFNIPADAVVYVFAALNPKLKGANTLIRAAAELRSRGQQNFILLMAGQMGYAQQKLAAALGVRDVIRFVGATSQMAQLYCAGDVTVLPTFYDPSSKVVIESLMLGVPAISTRYNGASDMILPGGGISRGRVIENPADATALADAMEQLADPAARAHCAEMTKGLHHAFSMKVHVQKLLALFEAAAGDGRGNGKSGSNDDSRGASAS